MTTLIDAPVVVGADGSPSSLHAVEQAAAEAAMRHLRLQIVHAFQWPVSLVAARPAAEGAPEPADLIRAHSDAIITEAKAYAQKTAPDLTITTEIADGPAAFILIERSRHAALTVIGDRGLGQFEGMLAGTVATQLATYGASPVVVVKARAQQNGPVVVGVDGSPRSARALQFAADEATLHGAELVAVHVWRNPATAGAGDLMPLVYDLDLLEAREGQVLSTALADTAARHPDLAIRHKLARGSAGHILESWSHRARLLVVGDRGHGGFVGLLIGSVSQHLIFHSACPVAIVRDQQRN